MFKEIKFKWEYLLVIFAIAFAFFCSYGTYTLGFITSDETINYTFSLLYKNTGKLYYEEPLNDLADNIIRPRGVILRNGKLVPTKFVGLPIYYGNIIKVMGEKTLPYLTPCFASLGLFFIYLLGRELYGRKNGLISAFLALVFPPFVYWSNFPLMENIFASVFFVLGLWAIFRGLKTKKIIYYLLAPISLGVAWNVRPDTTLFLVPLALVLLINIRKINIKFLLVGLAIFLLTVSPILIINKQFYGAMLATGQTPTSDNNEPSGIITSLPPPGKRSIQAIVEHKDVLFNNIRILNKAAPLFFFFGIGIIYCFKRQNMNKKLGENSKSPIMTNLSKWYCGFILLSILVFTFFYLTGVPATRPVLLHNSYTRYFLPLYLACLPLLSLFIQELLDFNKLVIVLFVTIFIFCNISFFLPILKKNWEYRESLSQTADFIVENTQSNSVIFTRTLDKAIFPRRKVAIISSLLENERNKIGEIVDSLFAKDIPLYIYDYNLDLNSIRFELEKRELSLERIKDSSLYKIAKQKT